MRFGVWDLWKLVFASGNVVRHLVKDGWDTSEINERYRIKQEQRDIARSIFNMVDPELEVELKRMINDPNRYDEVWQLLEYGKRRDIIKRQEFYKLHKIDVEHPEFTFVDQGRVPFDNDTIKNQALIALMSMKGKCPSFCVEEMAKRNIRR